MSAEIEARDRLRRDAQAHYAETSAAILAFSRAVQRLRSATDVLDAMRHAAELALAAEAMHDTAGQMEADARSALLAAILATTPPNFRLENGHTVFTKAGKRKVHIVNEKEIPEHLWTKPRPDLRLVYDALVNGDDVPGAVLGNAGEPVLVIRKPTKQEQNA